MISKIQNAIEPTQKTERIILLDSLRGIAVLGILIMNIPFFGLPDPAGYNPVALDEIGTINEKIFIIVNGYIDGTQRAMFSMLFGAGILLFVSRLETRAEGLKPADYFLRRQLWLLAFGLFNAYVLLWPGDILFPYGVCGIILFVFRKMKIIRLYPPLESLSRKSWRDSGGGVTSCLSLSPPLLQ